MLLPTLALALLVVLVLFEPLFLDVSLLSVDNRITNPFLIHVGDDEAPRPMNVDSIDINAFIMPEALLSASRWKAGELPLWNDCQLLGQPQHASMSFVSFYPTALLYLIMDPLRAYAVALAVHLVVLGLGSYLFFFKGRLPATPALFGAMLVMFCGFLTVRFHLGCFIQVAAWYPWILLKADGLIDRPTPRRTAVLAVLIGLSLMGGFPQIALFGLYVAAAVFLLAWFRRSRRVKPLMFGLVALVAGGLLSAVAMLPAKEFLDESSRDLKMPREAYVRLSMEYPNAVGAVFPRFFGDPVQVVDPKNPILRSLENFPTNILTTRDKQNVFTENTFYMGCIPLVLAMIALSAVRKGRGRWHLAMVLIAFGVAFGVPVLVDGARHLPGTSCGIPRRALWIASFSLAWLAAAGAATIMRSPRRWQRIALVAGGTVCVSLGILSWFPFEEWVLLGTGSEDMAWFRESVVKDLRNAGLAGIALLLSAFLLKQSAPTFAVIVLIVGGTLEVTSFTRDINPFQDKAHQYKTTPAIEWLKDNGAGRKEETGGQWRIVSFANAAALPGSVAQIFGIRSLNGYVPMTNRATAELLEAMDPGILKVDERVIGAIDDVDLLRLPLLDLLGVRFVVCGLDGYNVLQTKMDALPDMELRYMNKEEVFAIYERKTALPPAFMVEEVVRVADKSERLKRLVSEDFEPERVAFVTDESGVAGEGRFVRGKVEYARPTSERIELDVDSMGPGFVVVSETHFPGWEATLDGERVPLVQANHALMGVRVPEGTHRVEIVYRPASFRWGAGLSCVGLLICLVLYFTGRTEPRGPRFRAKSKTNM